MENTKIRTWLFSPEIKWFELASIVVLVTFMTDSPFKETTPQITLVFKILGYTSVLLVIGRLLYVASQRPKTSIHKFIDSYRRTLIVPLILYFLGLIIGALNSPAMLSSLWQTFSDAIVFIFAFLAFGWLLANLKTTIERLLKLVAIWTALTWLISIYMRWEPNIGWTYLWTYVEHPGSIAGIFDWTITLAHVLMIGSLSALAIGFLPKEGYSWRWIALSGFLLMGVVAARGRSAIIATMFCTIAILATKNRRLALGLMLAFLLIAIPLVIMNVFMPDSKLTEIFTKTGSSLRIEIWSGAIENLRHYWLWGTGAGQVLGSSKYGPHNFFIEVLGEGGIISLLGTLAWLIIPILELNRSRLPNRLAWSIVTIMAANLIHLIFHSGFLNGLRFQTLILVCLWTALSTQKLSPNPRDKLVTSSGQD